MKYSIIGASLICLSMLTGCNLNDLSNAEAVKSDVTFSSVSLDKKHGLVGNQIITIEGNHWVKSQQLPANNSGWSGETVSINKNHAIIADAHNQSAKIFSLNTYTQEWELGSDLYEPNLYGFGESVYIDNRIALVGVPFSNQVISYKNMNGYWEENERVTPNLADDAYFGGSIDYQNGYLFVGAKTIDKVFIYKQGTEGFELIQTIDHFDAAALGGKQFGWSLDAQGDQLAIAAYRDWSTPDQSARGGKVHLYNKEGTSWVLKQAVTAFEVNEQSGEAVNINGYNFGHNLALNDTNLLVGDDGLKQVFQFKLSESDIWQATRVITPALDRTDNFGYFIDINNNYLLTGGSSPTLFGPQVPKATVEGRVLDANGFPIYRASISGFLDNLITDETGTFTTQQAISWQGSLEVTSGAASQTVELSPLLEDRTLADIQLDVIPQHMIIGGISGIPRSVNIDLLVSGEDGPITTRSGRFRTNLPNGWQGEIRPTSDIYTFVPESFSSDGLTSTQSISFQAALKN
ncbi:hypothetical protein OA92_13460 [Marinomonas sp. SBI22]|uniref:carboxypeptidase regulatory-like domain-containing protein n=1 Tax=unclassified Marinomonas TaxID=196814 RepID=UPI0007AF7134|nr:MULTISPECIES: carboxypeptidase regulatory-like domain-containing protein [unclassified Marinomonas]KZM41418.1 hypothetical protein OA92_13460 [Marinomonas sp. SBI22]KZM43254.1 hypothetical protein OA91_11665 [Marinomonas sp. SBI8L]